MLISPYLSLRRKDFLNTDLVNEVLTTQVNQMGSLLVVRQVRTDTVDHHQDESAIIQCVTGAQRWHTSSGVRDRRRAAAAVVAQVAYQSTRSRNHTFGGSL